ncbi:MAG: hypothetical protein EOP88_13215 [Verrucomicrobiaceae bacterium]|nr:MAG: hypothetical protein EOP88_13215 [Verrucomicrobiaceae bacterium]
MHHTVGRLLVPSIAGFLLSACAAPSPKVPERTEVLNLSTTISEGRRAVSGRLSFPPHSGQILLIETGDPGEGTVSAGFYGTRKELGKIDPSAPYRVELLTTVSTSPFSTMDSVLKISRDGRTLHDATLCPLHHRTMKRQIEESVSSDDCPASFHALQERKFPNSGVVYLTCGSGISHPNWRCATCYEAYLDAAKKAGVQTH